jgi:hypothetical protein
LDVIDQQSGVKFSAKDRTALLHQPIQSKALTVWTQKLFDKSDDFIPTSPDLFLKKPGIEVSPPDEPKKQRASRYHEWLLARRGARGCEVSPGRKTTIEIMIFVALRHQVA